MSDAPTPSKKTPLKVVNLDETKFQCVFPACGGICCRTGEPRVEQAELAKIEANLEKFRPHLRPVAQEYLAANHFTKFDHETNYPRVAATDGWCLFFNEGCVLHKIGAMEGDKYAYKPWLCVTFPLEMHDRDRWHIRQWGKFEEDWDLFCLNPAESPLPARETLADEIAFAKDVDDPESREAWRRVPRKQNAPDDSPHDEV